MHKAAGTPLFAAAFVLHDGSVSVVVRLLDLSRYSAAIGNLHAMLLGPIPDRLGLLAIRGRAIAATATPRAADLTARLDEGLQRVAQLLGMCSAEVDFVFRPVDGEPNGLFRFRAVKVVYDLNDGLAGHDGAFLAGIPDELEAYRRYVRKQAFLVEWLAMTDLESAWLQAWLTLC